MKKVALSLLLFLGVFFYADSAQAATYASGTLSGNVVWTKANSPYIAGYVAVPQGTTLTIEPGTIIKVSKGHVAILVQGGSLHIGSPDAEQVIFTSLLDDSVAGDTNNDGNTTSPSVFGDWHGISLSNKGMVTVNAVSFRYGGLSSPFLNNAGGTLTVTHCDFSYFNYAIITASGTTTVRESSFSDGNLSALTHKGGILSFGKNTFIRNGPANTAVSIAGGEFHNEGGNSGEGGIWLGANALMKDVVLPRDGLPYAPANVLSIGGYGPTIPAGVTVTIEPGAVIKLKNRSTFNVFGTLAVGAPDADPVIFTSQKDDTIQGDTNKDGASTAPAAGDWCALQGFTGGAISLTNVVVRYGGCQTFGQVYNLGSDITIKNAKFSDSFAYHILNWGGTLSLEDSELAGAGSMGIYYFTGMGLTAHNNSIHGNIGFGAKNNLLYPGDIDMTNNWWGDASGPYHSTNPNGLGDKVSDGILFNPWLGADPFAPKPTCTENCFSNVMFLPGIKSSRLYKAGVLGLEDKLWVPNHFGNDVENLFLDEDGRSIERVYTKADGALDEVVLPVVGGNIYKSFLNDLANLKELGTINDYQAFAYDWRMNVEDIVHDGTLYDDGVMHSAVADILKLAQSSKSGKAMIIAHSNGGLFAKALMMELERQGKSDQVDKIIFVGTPQMGTPLAMLSMLYGYDESALLGTLISREDARTFAENMPGAYGLLPSKKYFDRFDGNPFVNFVSDRTRYKNFKDAYGDAINSYGEFRQFLTGSGDGRSEPANDEVEIENTLREKFLTQANEMHERIDNWVSPATVEVTQIAGWGLDTVSGVKYTEKEKAQCHSAGGKVPSCMGIGEYEPIYEPEFTVDGDEVVVTPSALMMATAPNVKRYWVDLWSYDDPLTTERKHKDLFEVTPVRKILSDIIENLNVSLPENIKNSRPSPDGLDVEVNRLRMSLYSPLDIHLYDDAGHHTGPKKVLIDGEEHTVFEEGIPNSYYYQFGDRKYVGFGMGEHIRVEMDGYAEGSYTLKLEEVNSMESGDEIISHTTFLNLPTTADTIVKLDIPETGIADLSPLKADMDGDGTNDYKVIPVPDGVAVLDINPPTTDISLSGTHGADDWFTDTVTVTLSAEDDAGGVGVEKTEYSLDNGAIWNIYSDPFIISEEGVHTVQYFSTDKVGNKEEMKMMIIKIDKSAPEAKIVFNSATQKLDIIGVDNLSLVTILSSQPSPRVEGSQYATLTDEAGHTLQIRFSRYEEKNNRIVFGIDTLSYDGVGSPVSAELKYKWSVEKKSGGYRVLAMHANIGETFVETHYRPKENLTAVMMVPTDLDESENDDIASRPIKEKLSGMIIPSIITEQGTLKIMY